MERVISTQALLALRLLEDAGYQAYVVGGCVRDYLLGYVSHDIDITTSATPAEIKNVFSDYKTVDTGILHGTVTVIMGEKSFEITTFRTDGDYIDNRHPSFVTFSENLFDDLSRRDFTVNAIAYHPEKGYVDYFGGKDDIENGIIRAVGEPKKRFGEDGLRILRALRFASTLSFTIEEKTAKAIRDCRDLLLNISAERIFEETSRFLCGAKSARVLEEFRDVFGVFIPELTETFGFLQENPYHIYDVFGHTVCALAASEPDLCVRWAVLLHDIGKPACHTRDEKGDHFKGHVLESARLAKKILSRLRADRKMIQTVDFLIRMHDTDVFSSDRAIKHLLGRCSPEDARRLLAVQRADDAAHAPAAQHRFGDFADLSERLKKIIAEHPCVTREQLAIGGDDLILLGVSDGKTIGEALRFLLDAVIDGKCRNTKEDLVSYYLSNNK